MGLGDLPKEAHRLSFLVNPKEKAIDRELEISVQAGRIVGEIYDALLAQYCGGRGATADDHLAALKRTTAPCWPPTDLPPTRRNRLQAVC